MKTKIEKAWINYKCDECGKLIYPNKVCKVQPDHGKKTSYAWWRFCESCYKRIFKEEVKRR